MSNNDSNQDLVDILAEEFVARRDRGENCTIEEYARKYPQRADDIRDVFAALDFVRKSKPDQDILPTIPDYEIVKEIGRGGMGIVYEARQISLDRRVALKVVPQSLIDNELSLKRFELEARTAAQLEHDNIVPVYDFGFDKNLNYFSMRLIDGSGLDCVIEEVRQIVTRSNGNSQNRRQILNRINASDSSSFIDSSSRETNLDLSATRSEISSKTKFRSYYHNAAQICLQAAEALSYAHEFGIVHRDIKPSNLLLDKSGKVWVADFGLAKSENQDLTSTGNVVGTLRFLSPERLDGINDKRSDVYSLGMTLYELLSLKPAFQGPNQLKILEKIRDENPSSLQTIDNGIPNDLQTIVEKAIEKEPRRRYNSAEEMAIDLKLFLTDRPINARRVTKLERLYSWAKRNPSIAASLTAVFVLLLAGLIGSSYMAYVYSTMASEQVRLRSVADDRARENSQNLYFAEMRLAYQAAKSESGLDSVINYVDRWSTKNQQDDFRGFEWYWLSSQSNNVARRIDEVSPRFVEFSPDGSNICFGHLSYAPVIKSFPDLKTKRRLDCGDVTYFDFSFSRDGQLVGLLTHSKKEYEWQKLTVFNVETGQVVFQTENEYVLGFDFHPIKNQLAVLFTDDKSPHPEHGSSHFEIYETNKFDLQHHSQYSLTQNQQLLRANVKFHPQGHLLTVSRLSKQNGRVLVDVYDTDKWKFKALSPWSAVDVLFVEWHKENDVLAAATSEGRIVIWDIETNELRYRSEDRFAKSLQWHPNSEDLVIARRNYVKILDAERLELKQKFSVPHDFTAAAFSPDGKTLLVATNQAGLLELKIDIPAERQLINLQPERDNTNGNLFWSADESLICCDNGPPMTVWNADTGERFTDSHPNYTIIGTTNGWNEQNQLVTSYRDEFTVWDSTGRNKIQAIEESERLKTFALLPNNKFLSYLEDRHELAVWNANQNKMKTVVEFKTVGYHLTSSFHSDSSRLAISDQEKTTIIDVNYNSKFELPSAIAHASTWSNDGERLAVACGDNSIEIYDFSTREHVRSFLGSTGRVVALDWSPDGKRLAAGSRDKSVRIWDTSSGQIAMSMQRNAPICNVAWSPSGKQLAALSTNGELKIWDARSGYDSD